MKKFYGWLNREVTEGLEPAKGIVNGIVIGLIFWAAVILFFYAGYLMLGGK